MQSGSLFGWSVRLLLVLALAATSAWAQFTASIQGSVADPSGASIAQAKVSLENLSTHVTATTTSASDGSYRFISLAPGSYKISAEASGFARAETTVNLDANENLNLPLSLKVGATSESIEVTAENPLVNTAETRNQLTL